MGKKYLDTKKGSLEQSILGVWNQAASEQEEKFDGRTKDYKEHRTRLEGNRTKRESLKKGTVKEASGDKEAYKKFFDNALKKFKVKSPAEFKSDEEKKNRRVSIMRDYNYSVFKS